MPPSTGTGSTAAGGTFESDTNGTYQSDTPGTFQTVTDGTFHSAMTGTFQSDTGGTSIPLLSDKPNRKWTTDISQVTIHDKKLYISPIQDLYNGEIVTCAISNSPNMKLVLRMANKAIKKFDSVEGLIMHSDQGWQYQHQDYQKLLKINGITQSMSRKGNCYDNAAMESFFGIMKNELLYSQEWKSAESFKHALRAYIHYYNNDRIKLRLNGMSPVQYRTQPNKTK